MTNYQTPCYVINVDRLDANLAAFRSAFEQEWGSNFAMGYSIKTNHLPWLLRHAYQQRLLAEAVSDDEYRLALACGVPPERIILNGPQKGEEALVTAVRGQSILNVDNFAELDSLSRLVAAHRLTKGEVGSLQLGLRLNFNLEAACPGETTAGSSVSRFGFCLENGELAQAIQAVHQLGGRVRGLHLHYSTKTRSGAVFAALAQAACAVAKRYRLEDELSFIDMGGGFFGGRASCDHPSPAGYAQCISSSLKTAFNSEKVRLIIEPGASVLATALDYRCRVANVRTIRGVRVVTLDGSSLHINPLRFQRRPVYSVCRAEAAAPGGRQLVCGNTCMEDDRFFATEDEALYSVGDEIVFHYAGAYCMAFNSCFIHVPPAVYLEDGQGAITCIRERPLALMLQN